MAEANVEQLRASSHEHKSRLKRLEAYPCPDCGEWHVGHGKPPKPLARTA